MPGTVLPHVPVFIHIDGTRWKHKPDTQTVAGLSLLALPDVSASAPVPACACAHARAPPRGSDATPRSGGKPNRATKTFLRFLELVHSHGESD